MAASTAWVDLAASERAAVAFQFMENAAGAPFAFKFLGKARAGATPLDLSWNLYTVINTHTALRFFLLSHKDWQ